MTERNNPKTVTLDLDNLVVKVSEVRDIEAFPQVTSCMIRVHHRGYDMDSEIWLEQIDDLVQLVDALDNLVVKVSEVRDIEAFPQVTSCMIRVHHRGYDMDSEIWLEQIDDLVQLVDALDSYIDMKGLRKEGSHE